MLKIIIFGFTTALSCTAMAETPKAFHLLTPDFNAQLSESEIIVLGKVTAYEVQKEVLDRDYYLIQVKEILKPALASAAQTASQVAQPKLLPAALKENPLVLVLSNNIQSSRGTNPKIEPGKDYLFFLQLAKDDAVANGHFSVSLTNLWQGVIPLQPSAENRALAGTLAGYDVDILKNPESFTKAIGLATGSMPQAAQDKEALDIAQKLGLQPAQK